MLVLSRKAGQRIVIGEDIHVVVVAVQGNRVKLGFEGPATVPIHRAEIATRIMAEAAGSEDANSGTQGKGGPAKSTRANLPLAGPHTDLDAPLTLLPFTEGQQP